jgi:hypothetical protein
MAVLLIGKVPEAANIFVIFTVYGRLHWQHLFAQFACAPYEPTIPLTTNHLTQNLWVTPAALIKVSVFFFYGKNDWNPPHLHE